MGFSFNNNVLNQKGSPAIYTDIFANRPAAGFQGRLFISTDTAAIYEDTGTAWTLIANVSSGAGTLQQVTTNGNTSNVGISVTAGGVSSNSLTVTSLTTGSVPFVGASGLITQDNPNLFWDDTNNRLGINTNTPSNILDVHTSGTTAAIAINNTAGNQALISFLNTSAARWRIGNTAGNFFDIINVFTSTSAISINSAGNVVTLIGALNGTSSVFSSTITSTTNGSTFGNSAIGGNPLIVKANAVSRAIQLLNTLGGAAEILAIGNATSSSIGFNTIGQSDAFVIYNDGSNRTNGDVCMWGAITRNLTFFDATNNYINAQIQYSEVNSNTGQLLFKTSNAGTLATSLTITNTGKINIGNRTNTPIRDLNIYGATNSNATIKIDGADGNGYGAQIDFVSKQTGGTSNTWTLGTGINGGTNAFELYNGTSTPISVTLAGNVGIGNSADTSQKLVINQGATANNQGIPATSGTTQNGILRLRPSTTLYGETFDMGMNVSASPYAWLQSTNAGGLNVNYPIAINPNGGSVGIGTSTPAATLSIKGAANNTVIEFENGGATKAFMRSYDRTAGAYREFEMLANELIFSTGASPSESVRINNLGQLQIKQKADSFSEGLRLIATSTNYWGLVTGGGANDLFFGFNSGTLANISSATGVYTPVSDINKKKDFEDSTIGLNAILNLKPTLFRMLDEEYTDKHLGFIAQEVKEFIPQAYVESGDDENKFIGLNYQAITAGLVKAIQEQQTIINGLLQRIEFLENKV